jgi:hypothetical protein
MSTATRIRDHCLAPGRAVEEAAGGDYRRLFPELEALDCEDTPCTAWAGPAGSATPRPRPSRSGPTPPTPMPRGRPGGRCSASSWPTTSPPTARP